MRVISCNSAYGTGGIGQHFAQLVEESREAGVLTHYYTPRPRKDDRRGKAIQDNGLGRFLVNYTPVRYSSSWTTHLLGELFDWRVAHTMDDAHTAFMGFVGRTLRSFERADELGYDTLELIVANSHVDNMERLHEQAARQTGIDDTWLNRPLKNKILREYEAADTIYVHSDYTRQTFLDAGFAPEQLERTYLTVDPRFVPPTERADDGIFRMVYVGRLDATKGLPLLLNVFDRLPYPDKELTLVGGWSNRAMKKCIKQALDQDDRIRHAPGDPVPALHKADVFVHPTYEDGFGYAPMEALACGVPVIATEDTGMKEYIAEGVNGYVVPTGDPQAIFDRLLHIHDHPMASTTSFLPEEFSFYSRAA